MGNTTNKDNSQTTELSDIKYKDATKELSKKSEPVDTKKATKEILGLFTRDLYSANTYLVDRDGTFSTAVKTKICSLYNKCDRRELHSKNFKYYNTNEGKEETICFFGLLLRNQLAELVTEYVESKDFDKSHAGYYLLTVLKHDRQALARRILAVAPDGNYAYTDSFNDTPLTYACYKNYADVAELIPFESHKVLVNKGQRSEITYALRHNMSTVVSRIIKYLITLKGDGVKTEAYVNYINLAIRSAAFMENLEAVEQLITNLPYHHDFLLEVWKSSSRKVRDVIAKHYEFHNLGFLVEKYGVDTFCRSVPKRIENYIEA
jgi:hypothetical protein